MIKFNNSNIIDWNFDDSNIIKVYHNGAVVFYKITSGDAPTQSYKWLATYDGGSTSSAECDASSAITENEISLTNLVEIEIGSCVTSIGNYAFHNCSSLASIDIPSSVTSIGNSAFNNCTSLTSVTIPDSVTSIGNFAFGGTIHRVVTVLPSIPPTISTNYLRPFNRSYVTIYVPSELVDVYKTDTNWSYYSSKIQAIPT